MQDNVLIKLDRLESERLLEQINPVIDGGGFAAATATVLAQDLSFYPGYRFLEIADFAVQPARKRYVIYKDGHNGGDIVALDGTNEPLYALNERAPVTLTENTVAPYVRFFFTYVRGRHGRFLITETVDDIQWREEPPPAARKAIGKILSPVAVTGRNADGDFVLGLCMMFKDSLFKATATVRKDGVVALSDEELLIEDMPVLDDTFGM
jgi:hypothetical protein